ncbi:MAG TPA: DUF3667 domain-containing protein [Bacteroidia bacterium]|nr:DUF3667 domain-containing protein [Bacteroidia bacterium]
MYTCPNCGTAFEGHYCPICRQAAPNERITWSYLGHQAMHGFFHVDRGLIHTIRELAIRPGYAIREYLNGKRGYHFNPVLFLVLTSSLASLLFIVFNISLPNQLLTLDEVAQHNSTIAYKYFALVGIFLILLLSATDYVFYSRKKFLFTELITSNTFQMGQILVFIILTLPVFVIQSHFNEDGGGTFELHEWFRYVLIGYMIWVRIQLLDAVKNKSLILLIFLQLVVVYFSYKYVLLAVLNYLRENMIR